MDPVKEAGPGLGRAPSGRRPVRLARTLAIVTAITAAGGLILWALTRSAGGPDLIVSGVAINGVSGVIVLLAYVLIALTLAAVGLAIASRVSKNSIGWILLGVGTWAGIAFFVSSLLAYLASQSPGRTELADLSLWLGRWTFVPVVTVPLIFVLMLVPDGHLPSARWRPLPWLAVIGITGWIAIEAFSRDRPAFTFNPYANQTLTTLGNFANPMLALASIGAVASVVVRFRRADQQTRQQIKWVAFGGAFDVVVTLLLWTLSEVRPDDFGVAAIAVGSFASLATPLANGVAILKYRLYDIDRLINRTVTYGASVGVLAAVYGLVAIGVPQLLDLPGDSPLLVAIATLAAFALFRPATRWIQAVIDRRFNRARYDARREVEGFTTQLTHRVAMDEVIAVTTSLLNRTLQPDELGVWIRSPGHAHGAQPSRSIDSR